MALGTGIQIQIQPTLDVASLNVMIKALKDALGVMGKDIQLIDANKLNKELQSVRSATDQLVQGTQSFATELTHVEQNTEKVSAKASLVQKAFAFNQVVQAVQQVAGALQRVLSVGNQYESTLAAVGAVTGQSGDGLTKLGDKARELAKEFGGSASDQLKSFQGILSKLGPQVADNADALQSMGATVSTLSAASGDDAATSMNALVDTMLQLRLSTGDASQDAATMIKVSDALAASAKVGAAEIPQVAQSMLAVGVAAKGAQMSLGATTAAIQVLAVGGKTGSEAGIALRNVLGLMQKASAPAEESMNKLGTSSAELGKLLTEQGLDAALFKIKDGMNNLGSAAERNATLMQIFGTENASAAGILLDNVDKFGEFQSGIEKAVSAGAKGADGAVAQANARLGTAEAITKRIQAQVEDVYISITQSLGSGLSAALTATTQLAPTISSLAGIKNIIPDGSVEKVRDFAVQILSKLVPGLLTQAGAQTAVAASGAASAGAMAATGVATTEAGVAAGGSAINFTALWAAVTGPVGLAVAGIIAVGAALYLLYENVEGVRNMVDGAIDFVMSAWSELQPMFEKTMPVLQSLGSFVVTYLTFPFTIAWEIIKAVAEALFSTSDSVESSSGSLRILGEIVSFVSNEMNRIMAVLDGMKAALQSLSAGIGPVITALMKGDFSGAISALSDLGGNAVKSFQDGFTNSYQSSTTEDLKKKLTKDLEGGITIQAKVEQQGDFTAMIAQYEEAQKKISELKSKQSSGSDLTADERASLRELQAEADATGKRIADVAPTAKQGLEVVRDASGNLKETFSINTQAAKEFANAQSQAYSTDLKQKQQDVSKNLLQQSAIYQQQEAKLKEIAVAAQEAAKAGKSDEARKLVADYEELKVKVEENGKALVTNFQEAGKQGMLTEQAVGAVGKTLGYTGDEAKKGFLKSALNDASASGKLTDEQIGKIAGKFGYTTDEAKKLLSEQKNQTAEASKTADSVGSIGKSFDEALKKANESFGSALGEYKTAAAKLKEARSKGDKDAIAALENETKAKQKAVQQEFNSAKNLNDFNKEIDAKYDLNSKASTEKKQKTKDKEQESEFARIKRLDEQNAAQLNRELELQKISEINSGIRQENDATELYYEQMKLEFLENNIRLLKEKLKINENEDLSISNVQIKIDSKEKQQVNEFVDKINIELQQQQSKVSKLEIKTNLDAEKLREEYRKISLEDLEQQVTLKVAKPEELIAEYSKELATIETKILNARKNNDAKAELELTKQKRSTEKTIQKVRDDAYKSELSEFDTHNKKVKDVQTERLKQESDFGKKMSEELLSRSNDAVNKKQTAQLAELERLRNADIISDAEYNTRKVKIESEAQNERETISGIARGKELENARSQSIQMLELERDRLEKRREIAKRFGDLKLAEDLSTELDTVNKQLEEKQDVALSLMSDLSASANEMFETLFDVDEDKMKEPLKKMLAVTVGFIERLASSFVLKLLFNSPEAAADGGLLGLAKTAFLKPVIEQGVGAILTPALSKIARFSTGGLVTSPTLAVVGDRASSGTGDMSEWILGSDQLGLIMSEVLKPVVTEIKEGFNKLSDSIDTIQFKLSVSGSDLTTATDRARTADMRRSRIPYSKIEST